MRPPAKLNLSLAVFDRRPDGFHDLHTVMATINLHDDLHIKISDKKGIQLSCTGLQCPPGKQNLVYQAAKTLADRAEIPPYLEIFLNKRIPSGAGLGGASSDAAACLAGLNSLWKLNLPQDELASIAAELGSDVPFFLHAPVAMCTGRGQIVTELPHRCKRHILLIVPDIQTPTKEIYQNYVFEKANVEESMRCIRYFLRLGDLDGLIAQGINNLTGTTMKVFEPIYQLKQQIESMDIGPVNMTGSGSCLFTTSDSRDKIALWAKNIKQRNLAQVYEVGFQDHAELFLEVHHADI